MRPTWIREGDAFRFSWPEEGVGALIDQLREQRDGELHAEVTWHGLHLLDGALVANGHIHGPVRINLVATQTQERLATFLGKRHGAVGWGPIVEQACHIVVREWRQGEPPVDLAAVTVARARPYLMRRLLPEAETSMLYADGGGGKSLVALTLAHALCTGRELPGGVAPTRRCPVAYFDWESNAQAHARRLAALAHGVGERVPSGIHYFGMARPIGMEAPRMRRECARLNVGAAVIDSAGFAIGHADMKEGGPVTELFGGLRGLGLTVLILHHMSKAATSQETGRADPYGSAYFRNSARNAWELRSMQEDDGALRMALYHRKDNDGVLLKQPIGWEYRWAEDGGCTLAGIDVSEDAELAGHQSAAYALRGLLRHDLLTISELADQTGLPRETVKKALHRSSQFRQVEPGSRGRGNEGRWGLSAAEEAIPW